MVQSVQIESSRINYNQLPIPLQSRLMGRVKNQLKQKVPVHPRLLYEEFESILIRSACLEYWRDHNFNCCTPRPPTLSFTPTTCKDFLLSEHPGDIASALSTAALETFYFNKISHISKYKKPEARLKAFCVVVCGIGQVMYLIKNSTNNFFDLQDSDLFEQALNLTIYPFR